MDSPIPSNLRRWMALRGLSITKLARIAGLHRLTVQFALSQRRKPSDRTVGLLAAALGIHPGEINPELKEAP